jgi:hypothetical protein
MLQSRSQWPRGLRHELSSPVRTLRLLVRIPIMAWKYVCVYSVFVYVAALPLADLPSKEPYRLSKIMKMKLNKEFQGFLCS